MPGRISGEIEREESVQGTAWASVHRGYFSDPVTAAVLVEAAGRRAAADRPGTVVDIGGGTGFILGELIRKGLAPGINLVNLDISPAQLAAVRHPRIRRVEGSVDSFRREDIAAGAEKILFLMRSVLHYLGAEGLETTLRHIRSRMKRGEYFIHQTACFADEPAVRCLNAIYAGLGTGKSYPLAGDLVERLENAGFLVDSQQPVPPLALTSTALGERYGINPAGLARIGRTVAGKFGVRKGVFETAEDGWTAWLHYRVFVTRAG